MGGRSVAVETCRAEREQERKQGRFNDAMEAAWLACLAVERCDDLDRCFAVLFRDAQESRLLRVDTAKRNRDLASKLADECRLLGGHLRDPPTREDVLAPADVICDAAAELCSFHQELTAEGYTDEKDAPDPRRTGYDLAPRDRPAYVGDGILMPRWRSRLRVKRARENLAREAR